MMSNREQGDLVVEVNEAFDDDAAGAGPATRLGVLPSELKIVWRV